MSIEGDDTLHSPLHDISGRLLPIQESFAAEYILALRLQEQEKERGYCTPWDDTGESIIPLLERSEREVALPDCQVRVEL
ncbi:MAG: hypothetical protein ACFFER_07355 [Candidatus Thorarchaeota archaeon]